VIRDSGESSNHRNIYEINAMPDSNG